MFKSFLLVVAAVAFLWTPLARTADSSTVAGKWHFVFDTPGGDREMDSIFEQNADKVTGKWAISDTRKDGDAVAGTFVDKKLALEFPVVTEEAGAGTMKITGTLADDGTLSGDWAFGDYSGTYKASRVKDSAEK